MRQLLLGRKSWLRQLAFVLQETSLLFFSHFGNFPPCKCGQRALALPLDSLGFGRGSGQFLVFDSEAH